MHLHMLINQLLTVMLPMAISNNCSIVNEVQTDIRIVVNADKITTILKEILSIVLGYRKNSCITISAKIYHDLILVHVKESNGANNPALVTGRSIAITMSPSLN